MSYQEIELSRIRPNPQNPRKGIQGQKFEELVASVKAKGVLQPIVVRPRVDGEEGFEIVAGERRWRAACRVAEENGGRTGANAKIPAMVRTLSDEEAFEVMVLENLQREDLTELEEAQSFDAYLKRKGEGGLKDLAERTGIDARYIRRRVRVLALPAPVVTAWGEGKLHYGHLEQLARVEEPEKIGQLFKETMAGNRWRDRKGQPLPVAELKQKIDGDAILLKYALFDRGDCKTCFKNSQVQKQMFGTEHLAGACCLDPKCFKQHQNDFLMVPENWKKTTWAKAHQTNGFRFRENLEYGNFQQIYSGHRPKECLACPQYVSRIPVARSEYGPAEAVCLDVACYKRKFSKDRSTGEVKDKTAARASNHGEQFREAFYEVRIPAIVEDVSPSDEKVARLALVAMIHKNHDLVEWFAKANNSKKGKQVGYWYQSAPDLWAIAEKMPQADVMRFLKRAALRISMQPDYGARGRHAIARHFGIDLARDWRITEQYLQAKTIKEILALGKKLKILDDKKAQAYLYEKLHKKRGAWESCKKSELIQVFLKSGVDLAGKVPEEILKVT